jgi:hypothetical protein
MVVMDKRCLAMVLYNPTAAKAAVEQQEPATKRPRPSPAEEAGAVIPYNDAAPPAAMVPYNQWRSSPYGMCAIPQSDQISIIVLKIKIKSKSLPPTL